MTITVGLFGTCGGTTWRNIFMEKYENLGITYYNPQVDDWKPELADIEAEHLASDEIILFPITGETYGSGSLTETGFSVLNAINMNKHRFFVILVDNILDDSLSDEIARKESLRSRALVKAHLKKLSMSNVYVVQTLEEMYEVSIKLYAVSNILADVSVYNPHCKK
jgi:hypothetical protein